jgi:hypothetical protein
MDKKSFRSQMVESINLITAEQLPAQFDELSDEDLQSCVGGRQLDDITICTTTTTTTSDGTTTTTTSTTTCVTYSDGAGEIRADRGEEFLRG